MAGPAYEELRGVAGPEELTRLHEALFGDGDGLEEPAKAKIYVASKGEHVDEAKRRSLALTGRRECVFDAVEDILLPRLSEEPRGARWRLLRGHYDVLRYEAGDFFLRHRDFSPTSAACVQQYSGLICLEGGCDGGRTALWTDGRVVESDASCVAGDALLFRTDVEHEGRVVLRGRKVVLRVDLLRARAPPPLPYFEARERFSLTSGAASPGRSPADEALAAAYAAGARAFPSATTEELVEVLDFCGCMEVSLDDRPEVPRLLFEGFAVVAGDGREADVARLWSASWRPNCCCLLLLFAYHQNRTSFRAAPWHPLGVLGFYADGTPALHEGFDGARRALEGLGDAEVAARIFGRAEAPADMAQALSLWACEADLALPKARSGPSPTLSDSPRRLASESERRAWKMCCEELLPRALAVTREKLPLGAPEAEARQDVSSEEEYCNDGDSVRTRYYRTTALHPAWCLLRRDGRVSSRT